MTLRKALGVVARPNIKVKEMNNPIPNRTIRRLADNAVLCWLATTGRDGCPNVSPKEAWEIDEQGRVVIAEIASAQSRRNIETNPLVSVAFLDVFTQKGAQLYGAATILDRESQRFEDVGRRLLKLVEPKFTIRAFFLVDVSNSKPIIAPSYGLSPKPSEQDMIEESYRTYGVKKDNGHS